MTKDTSTQEDQTKAKERRARGEFVRGASGFRHVIGDADFPPEPGRYHLFVALNCPWCHRVTLARNVLGLQDSITMDVAFPNRTTENDPEGPNMWEFAPERIATLTGKPLPECTAETGTGNSLRLPEVPRYAMYSGCVLDQIIWQMQRSGLLTATARLVAQGETVGTTTSAGTPAALELQRFGHFNGAITRNGSALGNVVSADITYANNLDRIETIRSDGRIDGADPSIAALTGSIEVRFADQTLVTQAINGDACELEFAYVLPSGESFIFTIHAVYLPLPRIEISGPQGVQATFDWQAARDSTVGRMCTATLINDVEAY